MEREERTSLLIQCDTSNDHKDETPYEPPKLQHRHTGLRARAIILGFECLDSTAFNGVATNLVVYLQTVLHGNNASDAANVTTWFGTSYLSPIIGAVIADTYLGNYSTILFSLILYLLGMILVTLSAFLTQNSVIISTNGWQNIIFFFGLYLIAFGSGGVRSALLPFGADQFDENNPVEREKKQSFFSWFYLCVNFGVIASGIFIVWIQENIDWTLGFGISTVCIVLAFGGLLLGRPTYKLRMPSGSPLQSICQVLVCYFRKIRLQVPIDNSLLYEVDYKDRRSTVEHRRLAHTDEFRFLDKAAIISEGENAKNPWKICTVTQVEELKIFLRFFPIWATGIVYSAGYSQISTTFIQQGSAMDTKLFSSISIPPASLNSFEVVCVMLWVLLYNKIISLTIQNLSQLQRMGVGRFLMIITMVTAAVVETKRLESIRNGEVMSIAWQIPQYFILAGSEMFSFITQLEFFHGQAPDSMKSTCTSFALLAISLGSYLSSIIVTVIMGLTGSGGDPGWIPDDLNEGHLDYFFWSLACLSAVNFVVYVVFVQDYKLKMVILES